MPRRSSTVTVPVLATSQMAPVLTASGTVTPSRPTLSTGLCPPLLFEAVSSKCRSFSTCASGRTAAREAAIRSVTSRNFFTPQAHPVILLQTLQGPTLRRACFRLIIRRPLGQSRRCARHESQLLGQRENRGVARLLRRPITVTPQPNLAKERRHVLRRLSLDPRIHTSFKLDVRRRLIAVAGFDLVHGPLHSGTSHLPQRGLDLPFQIEDGLGADGLLQEIEDPLLQVPESGVEDFVERGVRRSRFGVVARSGPWPLRGRGT